MKKMRLLLFEKCNRKCSGCCNNDWNLKTLSKVKLMSNEYERFDEILLTGGEPMLDHRLVINVAKCIRNLSKAKIYMYTAKVDDCEAILFVLCFIDGITLTLHNQSDVEHFLKLDELIYKYLHNKSGWSFRVNIFKGVFFTQDLFLDWKIKGNIEWIKNCPLPPDEVFVRL